MSIFIYLRNLFSRIDNTISNQEALPEPVQLATSPQTKRTKQPTPFESLNNQIKAAERSNNQVLLAKLAKYSHEQWLYYTNLVPVIFMYKYADNAENKVRGRVNRSSGFRQGVRNLNFVPANKQPTTFLPIDKIYRYYDITKANWRSFRKNNFVVISAFWSDEEQRYVDTPEEAGIIPGEEYQPRTKSTPATDGSREKRAAERDKKKREREQERNRTKRNEAVRRAKAEKRKRIR